MKVKLNPALDKAGMGFVDPEGQRIRTKNPGKGDTLEVKDTEFVRERIGAGELIVIAEPKRKISEKESEAIIKRFAEGIADAEKQIKNDKVPAELKEQVQGFIDRGKQAVERKDLEEILTLTEEFGSLGDKAQRK